jgi:hypothetical protein
MRITAGRNTVELKRQFEMRYACEYRRERYRTQLAETESRRVVGFEVEFLGAYVPLSIAATGALSRSGWSSAMDPSDR